MKLSFLRHLLLACAAIAALLITPRASAQDSRGVILGTLTDATGGLLPGVNVSVTNEIGRAHV